jgi:phospholipid transport system substrate-binding protein
MLNTAFTLRAFVVISLLSILPVAQALAADETPIIIVKSTITRIMKTLADDSLSVDAARKRVGQIASERINYYEMSKRILAINWAKADPDQQKRFIELFKEILSNTYWDRIKKYRNEEVVYFTSSIENEIYATVDTVIQSDTVEIPVTYRMKYTNGKWLAYDFLIENSSLIGTYRTSFAEIIKNHGMERLLKEMEEKAKSSA